MQYVSVSDRKELSRINKTWYEASLDPRLLQDTVVVLHSLPSSAEETARICRRRHPHLTLDYVDGSSSAMQLFLTQCCDVMSVNLHSLSLKGSNVTPNTFVTLVSQCRSLTSLDLSCCNSLFMTGQLLEKPSEVAQLEAALVQVRELKLDSIRYLSDVMFSRIVGVCPNVERLSLAGSQMSFHSSAAYSGPSKSSCIFTFQNVLGFIEAHSSQLTSLDLSRTAINDIWLGMLAEVSGLQLQELRLVCCREVTNTGMTTLCRHMQSLAVLDLGQCTELGDETLYAISRNLHELRFLNLAGCRCISNNSVSSLYKLQRLETLNMSACYSIAPTAMMIGLCGKNGSPGLSHMTHLDVSCCSYVNDEMVISICAVLHALRHLDLASCFGVGDISVQFIVKYLKQLRYLSFAWCKNVTDNGMMGYIDNILQHAHHDHDDGGLCKCTRSQHSSLIFRRPSKNEPVEASSKMNALIDDRKNDSHVYHISELSHLGVLNLTACIKVTDISVKELRYLELKSLYLTMCPQVSDEALVAVSRNIPSLETLHVSKCGKVGDRGLLEVIDRLNRLKSLNISNCNAVTNRTIERLFVKCGRLRELDVSFCREVTPEAIEMLENNLTHLCCIQKRLVGSSF